VAGARTCNALRQRRHSCANLLSVPEILKSTLTVKFDTESELFKLRRVLPDGLHFHCNFGFIPGTHGGNGDALDVAILNVATGPLIFYWLADFTSTNFGSRGTGGR
jgi:Inorganic pyrophosphatase